jgi:radical SAM superfamily enzyme YgiQ (UPF0313 family)
MAPALLKSVVQEAGFPCRAVDVNGMIYHMIENHPAREEFMRFFYYEEIDPNLIGELNYMYDLVVDDLLSTDPDVVTLSLLHYQCQIGTKWLCFRIRQRKPTVTIVIGGYGAFGSGLLDNDDSFVSDLKSRGLIDHYITGDGDISLPELLRGNLNYPGIDSFNWNQVSDLDSFPYPDYEDYDFGIYQSPFLSVLGSRGCVRQCTFCDIHEYWEKFQWRSGENIFAEMLAQNRKYGIRDFRFTDSLINGNVKEYNRLITLLAQHNRTNPHNRITWASYFIFRPRSQMDEEHWRLTAESGAWVLNVGVESLSEKNRMHIKKKFSNEDLEHGLAMAKKYGVKINFLIIVGYVTETEDDHQESLQWLRDHAHYANDPVFRVNVGGTLSILPRTWLDRNQENLGVTWREGKPMGTGGKNHLWEIRPTGNDYETRLRRMNEMIEVGQEAGFIITRSIIDPQKELENLISERMKNVDTRQI